ncbi:MAG TPA: EAL domain-containing protein [Trichocoleus sp.]
MSDYENLLYRITSRIRQSLELEQVLEAAVEEIQHLLKIDRAKVYRFEPDGSGEVIAEAVNTDVLPSLLHLRFPAADIPLEAREQFVKARLRVIVDVAAQRKAVSSRDEETEDNPDSGKRINYKPVDPCHINYLTAMGVASSLVIPILNRGRLWGLLAVHHSQPRRFRDRELQLLELLADQLEIAIAQAALLDQAFQQVKHETIVNRISQSLHYPLALPSLRQQVLATIVEQLKASGGRLHLLGDGVMPQSQTYTVGDQPTGGQLEEFPAWQSLIGNGDPCEMESEDATRWALVHAWEVYPQQEPLEALSDAAQLRSLPLSFTLDDLNTRAEWRPLSEQLESTPIRSLLIMPLTVQGHCLGYLTLFRRGEDVDIQWAGQCNQNQRLQFPKLSFEIWRELRTNQPRLWSSTELKLLQSISLHLSMSILQRRVEAMIRYQSSHDNLTGLPNRLLFTERLTLALMEASQANDMMAVAILDLNRFKRVNDSLGHDAGDQLLQQVVNRLQTYLRPQDFLARWGSDEFMFLLPGLHAAEEVVAMIEGIMAQFAVPFYLNEQELFITVSLGVCLAPYDGDDAESLIRAAGTALRQAQQEGLHAYHLYHRENMVKASLEALTLERDLRHALMSEQLELYYQPQLEISTRKLVGLEALIRWSHPTIGFIAPGEFIPLAEETGLITEIGRWALNRACAQQQQWRQVGFPSLRVSVNLSPKQFYRADLAQMVGQALAEYDISPDLLELEITESAAMQDMDTAIRVLHHLRQMGVRIALDDFGTGYSSLTAIKHFPLDTLKLDKAFIQDLMDNPGDAAIAQTIVTLGQGLGLTVLAEGVETESQLQVLAEMGCDCVQGYLFSRPLSARGITTFIRQHCISQGEEMHCAMAVPPLRR